MSIFDTGSARHERDEFEDLKKSSETLRKAVDRLMERLQEKDVELEKLKKRLFFGEELICNAGPLAWVYARPEHRDYLQRENEAAAWEKRAAAWLKGE